MNFYLGDLAAKRLELLHELAPAVSVIGMLVKNLPDAGSQWKTCRRPRALASRFRGNWPLRMQEGNQGHLESHAQEARGLGVTLWPCK